MDCEMGAGCGHGLVTGRVDNAAGPLGSPAPGDVETSREERLKPTEESVWMLGI
jgi:hypothetical protein